MKNTRMVVYGLYCVCHDAGIRYVGKTSGDLRKRFVSHLWGSRSNQKRPVHKWIKKHGESNIRTQVLFLGENNDQICDLEKRFIHSLKTHVSHEGLNVTWGGEGLEEVSSHPGSQNWSDNFTEDQIAQIKSDYWDGVRPRDLQTKHGIKGSTLDNILGGQSWTHVPWPADRPRKVPDAHWNAKLTYEQALEIKKRLHNGASQRSLISEFNSSRNAIHALATGKTWKQVPWPE